MIFHVRTLHMQLLYQQGSASIALFQYIFHFLFLTLLDYISLAFAGMFRCNPEALVRWNHKPFPVKTKQIRAMQTNFSLFSWPWHKIHCELYLYINLGHQPQFPYFHTKMQSLNFHCIFDAGCNAKVRMINTMFSANNFEFFVEKRFKCRNNRKIDGKLHHEHLLSSIWFWSSAYFAEKRKNHREWKSCKQKKVPFEILNLYFTRGVLGMFVSSKRTKTHSTTALYMELWQCSIGSYG